MNHCTSKSNSSFSGRSEGFSLAFHIYFNYVKSLDDYKITFSENTVMNSDPADSLIHILLINIVPLSLSLFCFPHKPAEVDEKSEELNNSGQGCALTYWWSSFPNIGVWTGEQLLATSNLFEGWMIIGQEFHVIRGSRKVKSAKNKNQTSQLAKWSPNRQTCLWCKE